MDGGKGRSVEEVKARKKGRMGIMGRKGRGKKKYRKILLHIYPK